MAIALGSEEAREVLRRDLELRVGKKVAKLYPGGPHEQRPKRYMPAWWEDRELEAEEEVSVE